MDIDMDIKDAKIAATEELLALPNVTGVGLGYQIVAGKRTGQVAIVAMVKRKLPKEALAKSTDIVPRKLGLFPVDVQQVGDVRALNSNQQYARPCYGGASIGHYKITAGTLGAVVVHKPTGERVILSNNHVLANSNKAVKQDYILQPGPYDGGNIDSSKWLIGILHDWQEINFGESPSECSIADYFVSAANGVLETIGSRHRLSATKTTAISANNVIDAAIALPIKDEEVSAVILGVPRVAGMVEPFLGMRIHKQGRTTGYTTGEITMVEATLVVSYGEDGNATFERQSVAGAMSAGGDSGSLGVEISSKKAFGLLFAGSAQSTIFNPITEVARILQLEI